MHLFKARPLFVRCSFSFAAVFAILTVSGCAVWRLDESKQLVLASRPFNVTPSPYNVSLLVVGDSTAVGTGASNSQGSLAGQIGRTHPALRIVNLAKNGAKFDAIAAQLDGVERFDIILIQGGGNDVIRLTGESSLRADIDRAVSRAIARSSHVIVMPAGNVGNAPFFFPPMSWLMSSRSRLLRELAAESAKVHGATFVALYREAATDPFALEPERMNSSDHLHPSDDGYAFWLTELESQAGLSKLIAATANHATVVPTDSAAPLPLTR